MRLMEADGENGIQEQPYERRLTFLYATQTGNAQDLAESLARHAIRQHFETQCLSMGDYNPTDLVDEQCVIFIVSTTGDGENPDSMKGFWKILLNRNIPLDFLEDVSFAVLGLGDTKYDKFCFPAKKLQRRLLQLGAHEILPKSEADEQHPQGTDGVFLEWSARLWQILGELYPLPAGTFPVPEDQLLPPQYSVSLLAAHTPVKPDSMMPESSFACKVSQNQRITAPGHWQDVRHIILTSTDPAMIYEPGDIAEVWPENPKEEVDIFLDTLHWTDIADIPLQITTILTGQTLRTGFNPPTLRSMATCFLDICSVPRRSFFEMLKHFSSDEQHVEKFAEFCTSEGQEELWDYTTRPRRTIVEVLADFWSSLKIPVEFVLDVFPAMKPRRFSIASSLKMHPNEIHLCVAIVKYKTNLKRPRYGVCTRWLADLHEGMEIPVRLVKGGIRTPSSDVPCVFVGPGTGIAPMRAMIEQRVHEGDKDNLLIFGNRNRNKDYLFEKEWNDYQSTNVLSVLLAFSRDGPIDQKKIYVQDIISQHAETIYDTLIRRNGCLFISGSSGKMPQGVKEAVIHVIEAQEGISREQAQATHTKLETAGRWKQETW